MKYLLILGLLLIGCAQKEKAAPPPEIDEASRKLGRAKLPQDQGFIKYAKSLKTRLRILPTETERNFTKGYVDYMISGDPVKGQQLIKLLKETTTKNDKKHDSQWISILGGGEKLNEKKINLGVLSSTRLMKLISFGDPTSIEFMLIYTASVELNEVDSVRIKSYESIIKSSYKEILKASILKNEAFLLDFPPAI